MGVFARLLRRGGTSGEGQAAKEPAPAAEPEAGAEPAGADAAGAAGIPKQQSAAGAADSDAGDQART
ncbi:hypothetical protein [Streptomyces synnematoformans]|uniref:Gliding motility protein n=1 Tax=Streptomyces synnematoformans TaxID=415721 RepID=A0ABN2XRW2_9ACTN